MPTPQQNTYLVAALMPALRADWRVNQAQGRRRFQHYNKTLFQGRLYERYPERVRNTVLLKTVTQYVATEARRRPGGVVGGVDDEKIAALIDFIFIDHADLEWPEVRRVLREHAGGIYAGLLPRDSENSCRDSCANG